MKNSSLKLSIINRFILLLSGLIAAGVAASILIAPDAFYATYGIELGGDRSLTNELKAPAGALLFAGLMMLAGSFRARLIPMSMTTAAAVFLSIGLSRFLSMLVDGVPHEGLVSAAVVEVTMGAVCLVSLISLQTQSKA